MRLITAQKWRIGFLGVIIPLALAVAKTDGADGKPILVIPASRYDAGTHTEGERVSHAFEVQNRGSAELSIHRVNPG